VAICCKGVYHEEKKARRNSLSQRALRMSGRLDSNQRPPEPIQEPVQPNLLPQKDDTASPPSACTGACTGGAGTANAGTLEALAAVLLGLSPEDRARLAAMLTREAGQVEGKGGRP
jgi:hypothetical protein